LVLSQVILSLQDTELSVGSDGNDRQSKPLVIIQAVVIIARRKNRFPGLIREIFSSQFSQ
jgi:hypothetical protein